MKYANRTYRLGTTAIAAALALSATSLAAQEVVGPEAPVASTAAPEPTAPADDPLAPAPAPEVSAPAAASEPTTQAETAPAPAEKSASKAARSTARPTVAAAKAPIAKPTAKSAAQSAPAPVPAPVPEPIAPVETVQAAPAAEPKKDKAKEALPVAGAAGASILALAGAGVAVRRRKRREDEDEFGEEEWQDQEVPVAEEPQQDWAPPVIQPREAPVVTETTTELPESFDTSKFGRHVQAAYQGPTEENPSLSLRRRLKIAAELDRRERVLS